MIAALSSFLYQSMVLASLMILSSCVKPASNSEPEVKGYWHWTYHHSTEPVDTTLSIAFFGSVDPAVALKQAQRVQPRMIGESFVCLGGGNSKGDYSVEAIDQIIKAIQSGDFREFDGLAYDVELGHSELEDAFSNLFAVTKANGLKVLVTVSHSAPYGVGDKSTLMKSFFANQDIDILSPQLYTSGKETQNDYTASGIPFSDYASAKAAVVPSIVNASIYQNAHSFFQKQGVELAGYIQWQQHSEDSSN